MRVFHIIKVIGYLLQNAMMRRSKYDLSFHREDDGVWYVDFPDWPFAHHNLAMVGGADKLCSYLADGKQAIRVEVVASKHPLFLSGYGLKHQCRKASQFEPKSGYNINSVSPFT